MNDVVGSQDVLNEEDVEGLFVWVYSVSECFPARDCGSVINKGLAVGGMSIDTGSVVIDCCVTLGAYWCLDRGLSSLITSLICRFWRLLHGALHLPPGDPPQLTLTQASERVPDGYVWECWRFPHQDNQR